MIDFVADARAIMASDPFKETIKYWPTNGPPRDIPANVTRDIPNIEAVPGGRQAVYETFHIEVINSDVDGIAQGQAGRDYVEIKQCPSDVTWAKYQIVEVITQDDPGIRTYEVKYAG